MRQVLPIISGAVAGSITSLLAVWLLSLKPASARQTVQDTAPIPAPTSLVPTGVRDRFAKEDCVAQPSAPNTDTLGAGAVKAADAEEEGDGAAIRDLPGQKARLRDEHQARLADHQAENRDTNWARSSEAALTDGFRNLQDRTSARMSAVDCRATSCVANVSWSDASAAESEALELVVQTGTMIPGCIRHFNLDEPAADGARAASIVFECSNDRLGGRKNE